jgi:hypothetical protein
MNMKRLINLLIAVVLVTVAHALDVAGKAQAGEDVAASKCLTIQPGGPREGEGGTKYFNIEGKDNGKFASFGVLIFEIPKKIDGSKIKSATLALVQSVPAFAKDGDVKIMLAPELDPASELKFDPSSDNGIGKQIKTLLDLGSGTFKKVKNGETQSFTLKLDDTSRERIAKEGRLCFVIVPGDSTVAATFMGTSESDKSSSPKLKLEMP